MGQEPREPSGLRQKEWEERKVGEGGKETKRGGGRTDGRRIKGWKEDKRKENRKGEERSLLLFHRFDHCCQATVDMSFTK